jgi:hypothetical protein
MPLLVGSLLGLIILVYHVSVVIKIVVTAKYHSAGQSNLKMGDNLRTYTEDYISMTISENHPRTASKIGDKGLAARQSIGCHADFSFLARPRQRDLTRSLLATTQEGDTHLRVG